MRNSLCEVLALSSGKHVDIARSAQNWSGNIVLEVPRWLTVEEVGGEVLVCEVRGRTPQITGTPNWIRLHQNNQNKTGMCSEDCTYRGEYTLYNLEYCTEFRYALLWR